MFDTVLIAGLGLMGGSMAKTIKARTLSRVLGWNRTRATAEQALADGCFGLALGLPLHLGLPPFVTGSKTAVKVLTEDMKELTGGQVIINGDAKESADILEQIILEKRQGLHI